MSSNKELIQQRINDLTVNINAQKATGKTYRAINRCIDELFSKPIGSQIHLIDDPEVTDNESLRKFADEFAKRMQRDFPDTYFKILYPAPGIVIAMRTTPTYQETAKKRLEQWQKKLQEMN